MKKNIFLLPILCLLCFPLASCSDNNDVSMETWGVDDRFLTENEYEKGTIEEFSYVTKDYVENTEKTETKKCNVYLPYGYSNDKQYNILYLIHGTDQQDVNHINTWFETLKGRIMIDNMIYYHVINPLIVVAPTFYSYGLFGDDDMKNIKDMSPVKKNSNQNFIKELRYDIIPNVEAKYSTFSLSQDEKGLQDSRNHRAIAGLSNGCRLTLTAGMINSFDYFSYYGCYSSSVDSKEILQALSQEQFKNYNLNYMFNSDGIFDFAYNAHHKMYEELLSDKSGLFNQNNTEYVKISMGYHSARSWQISLFDSLQRFFK